MTMLKSAFLFCGIVAFVGECAAFSSSTLLNGAVGVRNLDLQASRRVPLACNLNTIRASTDLKNLGGAATEKVISEALLKASFNTFINKQVGHWASERTYHYVGGHQSGKDLEQSTTVFQVAPLSADDITNVFNLNEVERDDSATGFRVIFDTIMRNTGRKVHAETDVVFLPQTVSNNGILSGIYLRSQGYEDKDPAAATFTFQSGMDVGIGQLNMVTRYSQVVSVDQITLLDEDMRMRRIVNYKRPERSEDPLKELQLLGFGVEKRGKQELK